MDFLEKTIEKFFVRNDGGRRWRIIILTLSAIIIFVTTYALILPALTLGTKEASEMDGIDLETVSVSDTSQPVGNEAIEEALTTEDTKSAKRNLSPFYWSFDSQATASSSSSSSSSDTSTSSKAKKSAAAAVTTESSTSDTGTSDTTTSYEPADTPTEASTITGTTDADNPLGKPEVSKELYDREDGTYDLTLSVTGKTNTYVENRKADVTIILDTSSSMTGALNGTRNDSGERIEAAKTAIHALTDTLYAQNTTENPDATRISLVTFGNTGHIREFSNGTEIYTSSQEEFDGVLDNINVESINQDADNEKIGDGADNYNEGTNWEDGLQKAMSIDKVGTDSEGRQLLRGGDVKHYVIFVSDGNPTFRNTMGNYYLGRQNISNSTATIYNQQYNYIGTKYDGAKVELKGAIDDSPFHATYGYYYSQGTAHQFNDSTHNPNGYEIFGTGQDEDTIGNLNEFGYMRADGSITTQSVWGGPQPLGGYQYEDDGTRNTATAAYVFNNKRCYNEALDEAKSLRNGMSYGSGSNYQNEFYGILAFQGSSGTSLAPEYMARLLAHAYGNDTYNYDRNNYVDPVPGHYFNATSTQAIENAFKDIAAQIIGDYSFKDVKITDTITNMTMMEAKGSADIDGEATFRYYCYGGNTGGTKENPVEFTPTEEAQYDSTTKQITWRPCGDGKLEDGVTYVVKCRVWPSQEAYDLVTKINNAEDSDAYYNSLSEEQRAQIFKKDGKYYLWTNGDGYANYDIVEDEKIVSSSGTTTSTNTIVDNGKTDGLPIRSMPLTVDKVYVEKIWSGVDENERDGYTVTFNVKCTDDDSLSKQIVLTKDNATSDDPNVWRASVWVSPGLKVTDPVSVTLDAGHTYVVDEVSVKDSSGNKVSDNYFTYTYSTVKPFLIDSASEVTLLDGSGGTTGSEIAAMWGKNELTETPVTPQLPDTGGSGTLPYLISGALLAGTAMILSIISRRSRGKEAKT